MSVSASSTLLKAGLSRTELEMLMNQVEMLMNQVEHGPPPLALRKSFDEAEH